MSQQVHSAPIRLRSYLSYNMFFLYEAIARRLAETIPMEIIFDQSPCDALIDSDLHEGKIDIVFICGLPMMRLQNDGVFLSAFSAPVVEDSRTNDRPVYFADVISRSNRDQYRSLEDLQGASFCYNDTGSNSGHHLLRHHLLQKGYDDSFFAHTFASGSHQQSIQYVLNGEADCAAIDSAVLAQAQRDNPILVTHLRIVESIGPCPIPPVAIANPKLCEQIPAFQMALSKPDSTLQATMTQAGIKALMPVSNADYVPILDMFLRAERANYRLINM